MISNLDSTCSDNAQEPLMASPVAIPTAPHSPPVHNEAPFLLDPFSTPKPPSCRFPIHMHCKHKPLSTLPSLTPLFQKMVSENPLSSVCLDMSIKGPGKIKGAPVKVANL